MCQIGSTREIICWRHWRDHPLRYAFYIVPWELSGEGPRVVVVYPLPRPLLVGGVRCFGLVVHQPASPSIRLAVQSLRWGLSTNPGVTMWCVCRCSWRDDVCECYRGGIVVMDVIWRRLCVNMTWGRVIYLFWVGRGCDEWDGEVSLQSC